MEKENKFKLLKLPSFFTSSCKTQNISEVIDHSKNPIFLQAPLMAEIQGFNNNDFGDEEEEEKYPFRKLVIKPKQITTNNNSNNNSNNNNNNDSSSFSYISSSTSTTTSSTMMCKPRCPETFDQMVRENCIIATAGNHLTRRKVAGKYSLLSPAGDFSGRMCPPASPASPLFQKQGNNRNTKTKTKKKKRINKEIRATHFRNNCYMKNPFSFSSDDNGGDWFSSDDEREEENEKQALFSLKSVSFSSKSISFSSDDDDSDNNFNTRTQTQTRTQSTRPSRSRPRRRKAGPGPGPRPKEVGVVPLEGKVKDTFAVVKSSSDPYNDFRTSMVEMIIEKQIFGAKELEQLLQCFLSLNSSHHHRVIVEVFTEICDALFSHFS